MTDATTFQNHLETYAKLLLTLGVNVRPDQTLVIGTGTTAIEDVAPFARVLTRAAYAMGARHVIVDWGDADVARTQLLAAPDVALTEVPMWRIHWFEELSDQGAAFLNIFAPDPHLYDGIDPSRMAAAAKAGSQAAQKFAEAAASLRHAWCVASVASRAWARDIYPDKPEADAVAALWEYIFGATRVTQPDPFAAWRHHLDALNARAAFLNESRFRALRYRAPGTDLRLELPSLQTWVGGGNSKSARGEPFVPNIPTEEVFCLPVRTGVDGVVASTMPLNYNGRLIDGITMRFEHGRILDFNATSGRDILETIIATDDGSHYLGEVALVTADSPVNTGTPVRNTLFDENASCHLAIGRAYPICLEGGATMSADELAANGANTSLAHVDFMIGSDKLDIDGETAAGELVPVLRAGMWAPR